jgi:hypothetical protein
LPIMMLAMWRSCERAHLSVRDPSSNFG